MTKGMTVSTPDGLGILLSVNDETSTCKVEVPRRGPIKGTEQKEYPLIQVFVIAQKVSER